MNFNAPRHLAKNRFRNAHSRNGFTLVELLVATGISIALAAIMIGITASILNVWDRSRGSVVSANQANFVLDQIASDLEGAFMRNDGNVWLAATILESNNSLASLSDAQFRDDRNWVVGGTQTVLKKPRSVGAGSDPQSFDLDELELLDCRFGLAGVWLRFFTTKQDSNSSATNLSAPTAVSYQIVRRNVTGTASPSNSAEIHYMLFRSEVRVGGNGTFGAGYDLDPVTGGYLTPSATEGNPGNVVRPNLNQAIGYNVIDFGVRLYVREGSQLRIVFPAKPAAFNATDPDNMPPLGEFSDSDILVPANQLEHLSRYNPNPAATDAYRERFPDVAEIAIRMISDSGAQMLQNLEAGRIEGEWWEIALANSKVFKRRIEIRSNSF